MDCAAQIANTFTVDYADLKNVSLAALIQVIREQILQILW